MGSVELIRKVWDLGGRMFVGPHGRLGVTPSSVLTDELRAEIRRRRDGIVALLNIKAVFPDACLVEGLGESAE
jgi:hypothetical protein